MPKPNILYKTIKAVFTGHNGSCGYETGKEYSLKIIQLDRITISKSGNDPKEGYLAGYCEYESIISFLNNWDNIRVIA